MNRVLITRPRTQADSFAGALIQAGFEPIFFPVIEIRPIEETAELDLALQQLGNFDWVIFTSVNGVKVFWARLNALGIATLPNAVQVAAIGPKTALALQQHGIEPDFVPAEYVAEAILPGLGDLVGKRVLLPRAEIARKALPEAITQAGGVVHEIATYQTLSSQPDPEGLAAFHSGVDAITFTSPSTVRSFINIVKEAGFDPLNLPNRPLIVCIGPITAAAARQEGLQVGLIAAEYTTEGLVNTLNKHFAREIKRDPK